MTETSSEARAFYRAIEANPEDDMPKLAYADWLEEQGDSMAEGIRWLVKNGRSPINAKTGEYAEFFQRVLKLDHYPCFLFVSALTPTSTESWNLPIEFWRRGKKIPRTDIVVLQGRSYIGAYLRAANAASELIQAEKL